MSSVQYLDRPGEPRLAWWLDLPSIPVAGKVLLIHGYDDHSARFDHVVRAWNERGLAVARFDLRGHGRSEGPRGHVTTFEEYVRDGQAILATLDGEAAWKNAPGRPVLFGHSLGGLVASEVALAMGDRIAGLACTSPFFGLKKPISTVERVGGKVARKLFPKLRQSSGLSGSDLTHDVEAAKSYDRDPLRFGHATAGWLFAVFDSQNKMLDRAIDLRGPLFCIAAGEDRIVSNEATERFFQRAGSHEKELDVVAGSFHELLNEPDWREQAARLAERMLRWSSASPG